MIANRFLRVLAALVLAAAAGLAAAQPGGSVRILVGFPAGGAPDAVARALADPLRAMTGATVIVENRPGASGRIAIDLLLSGAPDGQTLAVIPSSLLALLPDMVRSAKYDAARDFVTIGSVAEYGFGVAAGPASGAAELAALKTWARSQGRSADYATPGTGTPQHFLGAQLQKRLGIEMIHVPYRGGAPAVSDVLGGQVPLLIVTEQLLAQHEGRNKLRPLFVTSRERNPRLPEVPTARELGMAELEAADWFGLFARAGTAPARVDELRSQLARILANPAYREAMKTMGYSVPGSQPADFAQVLRSERAAWAERVKISGFQASE